VKPRPAIPAGPYLIVGLARSGVAAARALHARGEQVIGLDARTPAASLALTELGVPVHEEQEDGLALLADVRVLVKSPGVPADSPVIVGARERGLEVLGELELAWRLLENEFIAVTGTNGKTTTVELIGHIHREAGLPVAVAGNVGTALSSLVGALQPETTIVCEASSFQLEDTLAFAPEAAVLLNVTPDHLDRHGTLESYAAAKLEVFARQHEDDAAVLPAAFDEQFSPGGEARRVKFGWDASAELFELDGELWWQGDPLISLSELSLRGRHNIENAMAAAAVCLVRGLDAQAVRAGLASFPGVAHRLEEIAELDGVLYVNDSKALDAFAGRPLHLILGGQGKGQDFTSLREPVQQSCAAVYLIGEDAPTIAAALTNVAPAVLDCDELKRAVLAARAAIAGDPQSAATGLLTPDSGPVVLLSPACASFDQFADFEARGARFRELVEKLQG
jgi:UDP-N-acetylmuramoylalanine--D-glutamate ligase